MKKFAIIMFILSSLIFGSSQKTFAVPQEEPPILSAKGSAKISAKPDTANLSISIITEDKKLQTAFEENNKKSNEVYQSLKSFLNKETEEIKTANFNINPIYNWDKTSSKNILTGYRVENRIQLKIKNFEKLGKIIETAVTKGANNVSGLTYTIENEQEIRWKLLETAAKNARKEAEILSAGTGVKIAGVKRITSGYNNPSPTPFYRAYSMSSDAGMSKEMAPPVESGEMEFSTEVYVDFIIENPVKLSK